MTRIRKEPNRYWSKEDKLKMINEVLNGKSSNAKLMFCIIKS